MQAGSNLFPDIPQASGPVPLAERLRPAAFEQLFGQEHLLQESGAITRMLRSGSISSMILWGPPGCGKTTLARLIASQSQMYFEALSAVITNMAELKAIFANAQMRHKQGKGTLLLVDEIHRFNRTQQDVFLPYIEDGTIILVGATTENPSFELNAALLSRCKVLVLHPLDFAGLEKILTQAEQMYKRPLPLAEEARETLCAMADGDGRYLLSMCEELFALPAETPLDAAGLSALLHKRMPLYDKSRDSHYNLISAFYKSLRGSDVNAALYWLARMLEGGEDRLYIIRKLIRFAVEDIGLADPQAVVQALAAKDAYHFLGSPEGELAIAQAVMFLGTAPKSNSVYTAYKASVQSARQHGSLNPPKHILNAPTSMMKAQGYSKDYVYDHDTEAGFSGQNYFPETMQREEYYQPVERGFEREVKKRLDYWEKLRQRKNHHSTV